MQLFYTPDIDSSAATYQLSEEESRHCVKVLRLPPGSTVQLVDGKGRLFNAVIQNGHAKHTLLQITAITHEFAKRNHYLHIAIAPTKNIERLEWFLEKATEIGIDEITPVICQRSERREVKSDRLNKIITSAIKQSVKAYHPVLNNSVAFNQLLAVPFNGQKFMAHCEKTPKTTLRDELVLNGRYLVMIGPEGDFTADEIEQALHNDFKAITLSESRLRTETAALEACFEVNFLNRVVSG